MNFTHLRTFMAVVEYGSFSAAARAMHLSQPAVTMQVQALESELGVTLLDRQYRKVELTEAGMALIPRAQRLIADAEAAQDEMAHLSDRVTGRLAFAASTTPGQYILPRLFGAFLKKHPEVTISLAVMDTAKVVEAVESSAASIGMTGAEVHGAKVRYEELGSDDLTMICPNGHPLASAKKVTLNDVVQHPFLMREEGSGTRVVTAEVLQSAGIDPADLNVVLELGTSEAIVSAVEGGLGVAVVSDWVARKAIELKTVAVVPIERFPVRRPLFVVRSRGSMTRAAEEFLNHLRTELGGADGDE